MENMKKLILIFLMVFTVLFMGARGAEAQWTPTAIDGNTPTDRYHHIAVWTGTKMIVWGGTKLTGNAIRTNYNNGASYNLAADSWSNIAAVPINARYYHTAVWTGSRMIVWGGYDETSYFNDGASYNPADNTWNVIPGAPINGRRDHTAVWTGSRMIVWGGYDGTSYFNDGASYNPADKTWDTIPVPSIGARKGPTSVWTGSRVIVWGGYAGGGWYKNDGASYNPADNTWSAISNSAIPGLYEHTAVWTGTEMIVWGGSHGGFGNGNSTGVAYNPADNTWRNANATAGIGLRRAHTAVWAGTKMIVWGGNPVSSERNDGGIYNSLFNRWAPTPMAGAPQARTYHTAVWTGSRMIVWGGTDYETPCCQPTRNSGGVLELDSVSPTASASAVDGSANNISNGGTVCVPDDNSITITANGMDGGGIWKTIVHWSVNGGGTWNSDECIAASCSTTFNAAAGNNIQYYSETIDYGCNVDTSAIKTFNAVTCCATDPGCFAPASAPANSFITGDFCSSLGENCYECNAGYAWNSATSICEFICVENCFTGPRCLLAAPLNSFDNGATCCGVPGERCYKCNAGYDWNFATSICEFICSPACFTTPDCHPALVPNSHSTGAECCGQVCVECNAGYAWNVGTSSCDLICVETCPPGGPGCSVAAISNAQINGALVCCGAVGENCYECIAGYSWNVATSSCAPFCVWQNDGCGLYGCVSQMGQSCHPPGCVGGVGCNPAIPETNCMADPSCVENCNDVLINDEDGNGFANCADTDNCSECDPCDGVVGHACMDGNCILIPISEDGFCDDGLNNDCQNGTDCDDSDCAGDPNCCISNCDSYGAQDPAIVCCSKNGANGICCASGTCCSIDSQCPADTCSVCALTDHYCNSSTCSCDTHNELCPAGTHCSGNSCQPAEEECGNEDDEDCDGIALPCCFWDDGGCGAFGCDFETERGEKCLPDPCTGGVACVGGTINCIPEEICGTFGLPDRTMLEILLDVADWLLNIIIALAFLMIVIGGVMYISSTGNPERTELAKKTIVCAIIGLIIAGVSYAAVRALFNMLE